MSERLIQDNNGLDDHKIILCARVALVEKLLRDLVGAIEREAENAAIAAQLGVSEWEACILKPMRSEFFAARSALLPREEGEEAKRD